jgi:hypothetical protein
MLSIVYRITYTYQCILSNIFRLDSYCYSIPNWSHLTVTQDLSQVYKHICIYSYLASRSSKPVAYIDQGVAQNKSGIISSRQAQFVDYIPPGPRRVPTNTLEVFPPMEVRVPRTQLPVPAGAQPHITATQPPDSDDEE